MSPTLPESVVSKCYDCAVVRVPSSARVIAAICVFLWAFLCQGQQGQGQQANLPLSPRAQKIRDKVRSLSAGAEVTLLMKGKPEYHGDLRELSERSFSLYEVDEKQTHTIQYEDVKKVRVGYGGYNSVAGRHLDPARSRIAVVAVLAGLVVIVALVGHAKA